MSTLRTPDGTTLAFHDAGAGKPFVFVHGWTLSQETWDHHVHRLAGEFRTVTYDRRGHGLSGVPLRGYDVDTLAADLALVLDTLDLDDVTLVSHSSGCGDVVRYLSRYGASRVSSVVMLAPSSPFPVWAEDNPAGLLPEHVEAALDDLAEDRANWFDSRRDGYFNLPTHAARTSPYMVELTVQQCLQTPLRVQLATLEAMLTTDLRADFAAVDVPTTILHGALDQSTPLESCGVPAGALVRGSDLRVYDDAGHGLYITHRHEVTAELRRVAGMLSNAA